MADFQVTAAELKSKAEELRNMNSQIQSQVESLSEQEQTLAGMWEGDAQAAFRTAFNNDKEQMGNFYTLIEQYCTTLLEIADQYIKAEQANTEVASTRTYH